LGRRSDWCSLKAYWLANWLEESFENFLPCVIESHRNLFFQHFFLLIFLLKVFASKPILKVGLDISSGLVFDKMLVMFIQD
jgi:hypothetical protein